MVFFCSACLKIPWIMSNPLWLSIKHFLAFASLPSASFLFHTHSPMIFYLPSPLIVTVLSTVCVYHSFVSNSTIDGHSDGFLCFAIIKMHKNIFRHIFLCIGFFFVKCVIKSGISTSQS